MRQIKYRAWHKGKNKFLYFSGFGISWQKGRFVMDASENEGHCYHCFGQEIDEAIQQFTGLKDKNGKDIYEGDVLTYREKLHEHGDVQSLKGRVIYCETFGAFCISGLDSAFIWNYFTDMTLSDFEVVGNIFESK